MAGSARGARDGIPGSVILPEGARLRAEHAKILEGIEIYRYRAWEASGRARLFPRVPLALAAQFYLALARLRCAPASRALQGLQPPGHHVPDLRSSSSCSASASFFDHHDLNPELYEAKFARRDLGYKLVCWAERLTFSAADVLDSHQRVLPGSGAGARQDASRAHFRGAKLSGPRQNAEKPCAAGTQEGRRYLVVYLGVMGPQDGLELLLE